ncbi:hypothetical protein JYU19_00145 [bacterium AH-315-J21]|nr:hypothetical protein [bacterium AH-315-J21]
MLKFYLKRVLFVVVIISVWMGYSLWEENRDTQALEKSDRYALAVARLAIAEALQHDKDNPKRDSTSSTDSASSTNSTESFGWQKLKDSLLGSWGLNSDSIDNYINSFEGHEEELAGFWKRSRILVDSFAILELVNLSPPDTTTSDSSSVDTTTIDTVAVDTATEKSVPRFSTPQ